MKMGEFSSGMKVKVLNPFLYAYPLEGIIVCEKLSAGQRKYKVQFKISSRLVACQRDGLGKIVPASKMKGSQENPAF